ncbi:larval cuticle protein LCP-30-like [Coccinella septempunctata]|uniref:larval cuticle protein LCP-30-like n=1 Tax=Coccinella septempunctata TaxID=41139 RepID=UPI001D07681F|nr:larval cuticle protein LCP-30-like [Coccinella septempunctata]
MYSFIFIFLTFLGLCPSQGLLPRASIQDLISKIGNINYRDRYDYDSGQYQPDNSGKYVSDNLGRYVDRQRNYGEKFGTLSGADKKVQLKRPIAKGALRPITTGRLAGGNEFSATIIKFEKDQSADGYRYSYQTQNGINAEEQGKLENAGSNNEAIRATGSFSYTGPDNVIYSVEYRADENGFQPKGTHLP